MERERGRRGREGPEREKERRDTREREREREREVQKAKIEKVRGRCVGVCRALDAVFAQFTVLAHSFLSFAQFSHVFWRTHF